ncbi:hypothetical protein WCD74_25795 [Actinomycetospora sp. OC33-EN08]|uniref:Uncharacterized protein n=1 Tax=Actinomycetospora aurantiaca TaxID=3129233 RepID=A0ABU8MV58_9PSEU
MDHGAHGGELVRLRAAAAAVADLDHDPSATDPTEHADRFEALHEALAAALTDAGDAAQRRAGPDRDRPQS